MESILLQHLAAWSWFAYIIIFFGMMFEGDVTLFAASFLAHQRILGVFPVILVAFSSMIIGDMLWYALGLYARTSTSAVARWVNRIAGRFDRHIESNPSRTLFVSKFLYGLHHPILMRFGMLGRTFQTFFRQDVAATAVWFVIIGGLGYFFSASLHLVRHYLRVTEIALVFGIMIFFALRSAFSGFLKREL